MTIGIDVRLWDETGVGRYIRNLVINLQEMDKTNQYLLFSNIKSAPLVKKSIKNPKWRVRETKIPWHSLQEQLEFGKIIDQENLDLMHFTYFSAPFLYRKPFVVTIHDLIINHFPTGKASTHGLPFYYLKRLVYFLIIKSVTRNAKKIIAVSNATKQEIVDHLNIPAQKISVIYEGADPLISKQVGTQTTFPYILYVGNLYPHKNIERMIEAFARASKPKDVKLVIVGKKDFFYQATSNLITQKKLEDRTIFTGQVTDSDLAGYYSNATATIVPSLMEGFGLPALEAMENRCLVLCSDIPSLREICQGTAIYFNPLKTEEIKIAIEDAFKKNNIVLINNGFKRAQFFSWQKMARETMRLYESSISL